MLRRYFRHAIFMMPLLLLPRMILLTFHAAAAMPGLMMPPLRHTAAASRCCLSACRFTFRVMLYYIADCDTPARLRCRRLLSI